MHCLKKKGKKETKTKELPQNSKKGALESQVPPSTLNTCTIMKKIQVRMFLQKFKNLKLEPICTLSWNIIKMTCSTPRARPQWVVITLGNQQEKQDTTNCTTTKEELITSFTLFSWLNRKRRMAKIKEIFFVCGGIMAARFWTI